MPESLMVSGSPTSGISSKRQRSADSREPRARTDGAGDGQSGPNSRMSSHGRAKQNIRIPAFLEKSRSEISSSFQDLEWKQRFRLFHAMENPHSSPYKVDRSETVISRNRYGNVQPWDNSRIKLREPIDGSDYVNASPIVLKSRVSLASNETSQDDQQTGAETRYIASQGPKQGQYSHFWRMVHQETPGDTGAIIMLTQLYEANKEKCSAYFPVSMDNPTINLNLENTNGDTPSNVGNASTSDGDDPFLDIVTSSGTDSMKGGTLESHDPAEQTQITTNGAKKTKSEDTVTLVSAQTDALVRCEVRQLKLTIGNVSKTIFHYLFKGWPDFGKPEAEERKALIELTNRTREVAKESPRVVHCSAGVGRTGTWIALDFLIREVAEGRIFDKAKPQTANEQAFAANNEASTQLSEEPETWGKSGPPKVTTPTDDENSPSRKDDDDLIYDTVNSLREQRMMMVMNEIQYGFLYEVVREVFLEKYRAKAEGAVVKGVAHPGAGLVGRHSKVPRTEGVDGGDDSQSEAETEIMDADKAKEAEARMKNGGDDPYQVVAPESIQQGLAKEQ